MQNNSEKDYANSIYDSMYECGQRLAEEQKTVVEASIFKAIWNAAIEAAAGVAEINSAAEIRKLKK